METYILLLAEKLGNHNISPSPPSKFYVPSYFQSIISRLDMPSNTGSVISRRRAKSSPLGGRPMDKGPKHDQLDGKFQVPGVVDVSGVHPPLGYSRFGLNCTLGYISELCGPMRCKYEELHFQILIAPRVRFRMSRPLGWLAYVDQQTGTPPNG
jgi:hypothetical protein